MVSPDQSSRQVRAFGEAIAKMYPDREKKRLTLATQADVGIGLGGIPQYMTMPDAPELTEARFLLQMSCKADAVVSGQTTSKTAHLSDDETLVFTQYDFVVDSIFKNNSSEMLGLAKTIQVVRPGGDIILNGLRIQVKDFSFEMLEKQKNYLLFLKYVPDAHGFIVLREGDLELAATGVKKLSHGEGGNIFKAESNARSVLIKQPMRAAKGLTKSKS
jgi:hypothetical protein